MSELKGKADTFANRLRAAMDIRGVKKSELSRQTGISQQCMGQYVLGRYEAKQSALYAIAKALNVDPAWLMGYDLPMEPQTALSTPPTIANDDLKLALFGDTEVNDTMLEDVKKMAKVHLELLKKGAVSS